MSPKPQLCICFLLMFFIAFLRPIQSIETENENDCIFVYDLFMDPNRIAKYMSHYKILGPAQLRGYQLDFAMYSKVNHGCLPTLASSSNTSVWGVVYQIDLPGIRKLDEIKGIWLGISYKMTKDIRIRHNNISQIRSCFMYCNKLVKAENRSNILDLPRERAPSGWYMQELYSLALKNKLDLDYLDYLASVPHNNIYTPALLFPKAIIAKELARRDCGKQLDTSIMSLFIIIVNLLQFLKQGPIII